MWWPWVPKKPIVGISIDTTTVTCSILKQLPNKRFFIKQFQSTTTEIPLTKNITIFNTTYLATSIKNFIDMHKAKNGYCLVSLVHPGILERILNYSNPPQEHHLQQEQNPKQLIWDYMVLGNNKKTGKTHYYVCGIAREQLFHYQLLSIMSTINCIGIIPQRAALLNASHLLYPYHPDLNSITNHATLQNYFNHAIEKTSFETIFENYDQHHHTKKQLFESLGLFFAGIQLYENG